MNRPIEIQEPDMYDDLTHDQKQIITAVEDVLRTPLDTAAKMDVHGAAELITNYVFLGETPPGESMRYDWHYRLLGKAITIAQGWKQNFAGSLNRPSETRGSLTEYIDNTYGTDSCSRAGL